MEKKKITKKEVMDAVKKHQHFLNKDCDDWVLMRADFSNCLIEDIELKKLDMMQVNFAGELASLFRSSPMHYSVSQICILLTLRVLLCLERIYQMQTLTLLILARLKWTIV